MSWHTACTTSPERFPIMLESSFLPIRPVTGTVMTAASAAAKPRPVFRMEISDDDRINGSIPVWDDRATAAERVAGELATVREQGNPLPEGDAYTGRPARPVEPQPFGFGDLIDMINPLQHVPLLGNLYRFVTGDAIKPVARVVGDTVYGGPLAAAAALANIALEEETGRDIAGNLLAFAVPASSGLVQTDDSNAMPANALGFAGASAREKPLPQILPPPLKLASFSPFEIY